MNEEKKESKQKVADNQSEVVAGNKEVVVDNQEEVVADNQDKAEIPEVKKSWGDMMIEEDEVEIKSEDSKENDKIVIEVPESMAVEMLKMMMANGKTNFELKIRK
jgi:3-isopropylmalate dehydratase small subunit